MNPDTVAMLGSMGAALVTAIGGVVAVCLQARRSRRVEDTVQTLKPNHGMSVADHAQKSAELGEHNANANRDLARHVDTVGDLLHVVIGRLDEHGRRLDEHIAAAAEDRRHVFTLLAIRGQNDEKGNG